MFCSRNIYLCTVAEFVRVFFLFQSKNFDLFNRNSFGFGPSFIQWIHTFYKNVSSCVLNNGFTTSSFAVERGVRQGDPLSAYLFIIALEVLCVDIRNSNDIRGIKVDKEEITLSLFADDLTVFLKDDLSLTNFLKLIEDFGTCSGLKVNHEKTELLLLGNLACTVQEATLKNIKIKRSAKILGVHFTYDIQAKQKLNINELISSIQLKWLST